MCLIDIDPQGSLADWWNEREAEMPAFAQTTVARLASDLEVLRQQGFRLAVIDTPPAITMAPKVAAVSSSVSPFLIEECSTESDRADAPSRCAAVANDIAVRVEFS